MHIFWREKVVLLCIILAACHNNNGNEQPPAAVKDSEQVQTFFPVTEFLLGQLREIDSLPVTPVKITRFNGKTDSVWLKKKDIRTFAAPFLSPVIDSASLQNLFAEKSFLDQTIHSITLTYDPKVNLPDSIHLNHWDVYIDPEKGTVQRIYIAKSQMVNGENITTQLTWRANKWCSIRTIAEENKMAPVIKEEIMKWEFDE
ncbi:MAG TPA: hypothetical protein VG847_15840 [Chitinophagaceae bacterium]|nr:hypothetical protein [Chitinophagaceae bacterium]